MSNKIIIFTERISKQFSIYVCTVMMWTLWFDGLKCSLKNISNHQTFTAFMYSIPIGMLYLSGPNFLQCPT